MKLWGGRFTGRTDELVERFNSSLAVDCRLYREDIRGSMAHAAMLARQGYLAPEEAEAIVAGLQQILDDIESGRLQFDPAAEDVHSQVESWLVARIGEPGKRLHTGRSRNDQVALDVRMYLKEQIDQLTSLLAGLQEVLLDLAEEHLETIMPGFTHLQKAQPVTLAHHLMAYVEMFLRDMGRLRDCRRRTDVMPLGSGALAGTTFALDREFVRQQLGFAALSANSLDAVSDRDFVLEFLAAASIAMMHLSRFCEELVLWSSDEFGYVEMDDAFATGSSIMPQKKNPDVAELVRGKTGRVYGDLVAVLTVMKGLPLAYNKDMQEDKEALFDAVDTLSQCLQVFTPMLRTLKVRRERLAQAAAGGFSNATDLADYLVRKGVPFRTAHEVVGRAVLYCLQHGLALDEVPLATLKEFSPFIEEDVYPQLQVAGCVRNRSVWGGPAPATVAEAIRQARVRVQEVVSA
ncbi:MAG: argininosuccinate lyase [Syntrophomonadaceae bacterium]|nr:argininosuccinate lyase [Syntrophomonadaceae bacterium]